MTIAVAILIAMLYLTAILTITWCILLVISLIAPDTRKQKVFSYLLLISALLLPLQALKGWAALLLVPGLCVAYLLLLLVRSMMNRFESSPARKLIFYSSWSLVALLVSFYICNPAWDDSQNVILLGFIPSTTDSIGTTISSAACSILWWLGIIAAIVTVYVAIRTRPSKRTV